MCAAPQPRRAVAKMLGHRKGRGGQESVLGKGGKWLHGVIETKLWEAEVALSMPFARMPSTTFGTTVSSPNWKTTASRARRPTRFAASRWICASTRWWTPPTGSWGHCSPTTSLPEEVTGEHENRVGRRARLTARAALLGGDRAV